MTDNRAYIWKHIQAFERFNLSGNHIGVDNALFRIGSAAGLLRAGEEVTDANRDVLKAWVGRNAYIYAPEDASELESLLS